jgi:hypothetical protein
LSHLFRTEGEQARSTSLKSHLCSNNILSFETECGKVLYVQRSRDVLKHQIPRTSENDGEKGKGKKETRQLKLSSWMHDKYKWMDHMRGWLMHRQ